LSPDVESSIFESPGGGDCPDDLLGDTSVGLHGTLPPGCGLGQRGVHLAQLDKITLGVHFMTKAVAWSTRGQLQPVLVHPRAAFVFCPDTGASRW